MSPLRLLVASAAAVGLMTFAVTQDTASETVTVATSDTIVSPQPAGPADPRRGTLPEVQTTKPVPIPGVVLSEPWRTKLGEEFPPTEALPAPQNFRFQGPKFQAR